MFYASSGGEKMKRRVMVLTCSAMAAAAIMGGSTMVSAADTVSVAIWDNNQLSGLQEIANEWSEESGVDVEFQVMDWTTYWTMLEAGASGGEMPDVFWMHSANAQKYMDAGLLLDMNSYIEEDDAIDLENYFPGIVELYSQDGVQYAIPKDHDTIAAVYNKAVFDKYGIDYPTDDWTWEDFASIAQQIADAGADDGVYGTYMNTGSNQSGWYNIIYAMGGEIISEDKKSSGMDKEETIAAMNFVGEKILPACPSQDSMANTPGDTMLMSGKIGLYLDGSWMAKSYYDADNAADFAWVEIPYYDANENGQCDEGERASIYNGLGWSIAANSSVPDEAWSLISALSDEAGQLRQSELGVTMSGYIGCSEPFANAFGDMDLSAFTKVEEDGRLVFRPYSKYSARWEDDFTQKFIDAWNDPSLMEDTCLELAESMNSILAEE